MRTAGIVMLIFGLISLAFTIVGAFDINTTGDNVPFLSNSWFVIMTIFWGGAGLSILLTFGKSSEKR